MRCLLYDNYSCLLWTWSSRWNIDRQRLDFLWPRFSGFYGWIWSASSYRGTYSLEGNGITERCHHTVKSIAARTRCSIQVAVYWYNATPRDDMTALTAPQNTEDMYKIGDIVWVKLLNGRCTTRFSRERVDGTISPQTVRGQWLATPCKESSPTTQIDYFRRRLS